MRAGWKGLPHQRPFKLGQGLLALAAGKTDTSIVHMIRTFSGLLLLLLLFNILCCKYLPNNDARSRAFARQFRLQAKPACAPGVIG